MRNNFVWRTGVVHIKGDVMVGFELLKEQVVHLTPCVLFRCEDAMQVRDADALQTQINRLQ